MTAGVTVPAAPAVEVAPVLARWVIVCGDCVLSGGPYATPGEASCLARIHDGGVHGGASTARGVLGLPCRECGAPAATTVHRCPAGGLWRLCAVCASTTPRPVDDAGRDQDDVDEFDEDEEPPGRPAPRPARRPAAASGGPGARVRRWSRPAVLVVRVGPRKGGA